MDTLAKERPADTSYVPKFKIKPSVIGSPCLRKCYYTSGGVLPDYPFPLSAKLRMKIGDAVGIAVTDVLRESGAMVDYHNPDGSIPKQFKGKDEQGNVIFGEPNREFPISFPELFISSGKIDLVLILDSKLWIGEIKSINAKGFSGLTAPKPDHMIQGTSYYYIFNENMKAGKYKHIKALDGFEKAEGCVYMYVNKEMSDPADIKEYFTTDADKFFSEIVQKILKIKADWDSKTLPPKTQDYCSSCNFRDKCKKNFNPN